MNIIRKIVAWLQFEWRIQFLKKEEGVPDYRQYGEWNGLLVDHRRDETR